ncbi:hypothetical protein ACFLX2_00325, partial [Candidatus Dependentiae bacterium]
WIEFENVGVVLSPELFDDPLWGFLGEGVNVVTNIRLAGPLKKAADFIGKDFDQLFFRGTLAPRLNFAGSNISATSKGKLTLVDSKNFKVRTGDRFFSVGLAELTPGGIVVPQITGITGIDVLFPGQSDFISFRGLVTFHPDRLELAGFTDEMMENLFGIPGLDIGNLGLSFTFDPIITAATGSPIAGGAIRGDLGIGDKLLHLLFKFEFSGTKLLNDVIFDGSLAGGLGRSDIIKLVLKLAAAASKIKGININPAKLQRACETVIPPFSIGDIKALLVFKTTFVFGREYQAGLHISGSMDIAGFGGFTEMEASLGGIKGTQYFNEIKIPKKNPVLIFSGGGMDRIRGEGHDGPISSFELSVTKQELFTDCFISIPALGIATDQRILISPLGGIEFRVLHKLGGIFESDLEFQGKKALDSWWIRGHMKQDAWKEVIKFLTQTADELNQKAQVALEKARKELERAKERLKQDKETLRSWKNAEIKDVQKWVALKVRGTQKRIDRLRDKIAGAKLKCKSAKWFEKAIKCADMLAVPAWGTALSALEFHKKVVLPKLIEKTAERGIKFTSDVAQAGVDAAKVAVDAAKIATRAAVIALGAANKVAKVAGKILKVAHKGLIDIKEISVAGSLKDLVKRARMAEVRVKASIFGKPFDQQYQIDFKNPKQFPSQIWNGLKQIFD